MLEWLKRHAWKACNRQNRFGGSNPPLSAESSYCKKCFKKSPRASKNRCDTFCVFSDSSFYFTNQSTLKQHFIWIDRDLYAEIRLGSGLITIIPGFGVSGADMKRGLSLHASYRPSRGLLNRTHFIYKNWLEQLELISME